MAKKKEIKLKSPKIEEKKKEEKAVKVEPKIVLKAWFKIRKINPEEYLPRSVYSAKKNMIQGSIKEWDEFFKKY